MNDDGTVAWRELLAEATDRFQRADVPEPDTSARLIVAECAGADGPEFALVLDDLVTERGMAAFDKRVARRLAGEPLQYVLGRWAFRTLDLFVDHRVLIPRPETEVVAGVAIAELERVDAIAAGRPRVAADLGCGSGAIGLSLAAEVSDLDVWLTDVSDDALAVARGNVAGLGRKGARVRIAAGSWFEALDAELRGAVDVVVSNPPYIAADEELSPTVAGWEPSLALVSGPSGTEALDRLVDEAGAWLRPDGALVLEMSPWQTDPVAERARRHFAEVETFVDLAGLTRGILARFPHGVAS